MIPKFKLLIREYIKEYIEQNQNLTLKDLNIIGKMLVNKLENLGFIISRSSLSLKNILAFDAEKSGKAYQVIIRKKINPINEDEVEKFDRNELKKLFPDMFKNVNKTQNQNFKHNTSIKSATKNLNNQEDYENTLIINDDDFVFAGNFEYIIEFQDKSKNYDVVIQHRKKFNNKKQSFENFANEITSEIIKNFK